MTARQHILATVEAFIASSSISAHALGLLAVHDHKAVGRLRSGYAVSLKTIEGIERFIAEHQSAFHNH